MTSESACKVGDVIDGRYRIEQALDTGGQGDVFRAGDLREGDQVAIKVLKERFAADGDWRERMLREARAMAVLQGTAAVRVFDQRFTAQGALCLVMELLEGEDLLSHVRVRERNGLVYGGMELLELLEPVVRTLQLAHENGIVHRDLKPENVFVTRAGGVRLLDFGFAKFTRMPGMTAAGTAMGSPSFMAPEVWLGNGAIDGRADVYSMAVIVFRLLAGKMPFQRRSMVELYHAVIGDPRPSLHALRPDLPPAIDGWLQQALAVDPAARFLQMRALWTALRCALS